MTTIYRAANTADPHTGTHWTSCPDEAAEYTRNPGFGGSTVWSMELAGDVVRCDDTVELAEVMMANGFSMDHPYIDGMELNAREIATEWAACGHDQVFHVLENTDALDYIEGDWIRFNEPSIAGSHMSATYRKL